MMSSDHEILLDIQGSIYRLNTRLERVENDVAELKAEQKKQGQEISELKAGLQETNTSVKLLAQTVQHLDRRLTESIADLRTTVGWIFAAIGLFLAIAALFRREKNETSKTFLSFTGYKRFYAPKRRRS